MKLSGDPAPSFVDQDGWTFAVQVEGNGPPVVFLHGLLTNSTVWDPIAHAIADTHTVVRVDAPGHGSSPARDRMFSLENEADALAGLIRSLDLGPAPVWVGHSMGGMKAMRVCLTHPGLVAALVLISTQPFAEPERTARPYRAMVETALAWGISDDLAQMIGKLNFGRDYLATPAGQRWVRHFSRIEGPDIAAMSHAVFGRGDISGRLAELDTETLVIHGADDIPIRVRVAEEYSAGLPRGRLVVLPDCGHTPPCEQASRTVKEIRTFLAGVKT